VQDPTSPRPQPLEDHALATRLSLFLWSTMPDDALTAAADRGALTAPGGAGLEAEIARILVDPKAQALIDDLAGQWLGTRDLVSVAPDPMQFGKAFDSALLDAMGSDTRLFFGSLIRENQPLGRLLTADYSFVNDRLATHYGLPAVRSASVPATATFPELVRVSLVGTSGVTPSMSRSPSPTGPPSAALRTWLAIWGPLPRSRVA
jgi:hypothetical protein